MLIYEFYSVIGDEITYRIALLLARYTLSVGEISRALNLPQPQTSHKLAKLRRHECVSFYRSKQRVLYSLRDPCRTIILRGDKLWRQLKPEFRNIWSKDLARLKEMLKKELDARVLTPIVE